MFRPSRKVRRDSPWSASNPPRMSKALRHRRRLRQKRSSPQRTPATCNLQNPNRGNTGLRRTSTHNRLRPLAEKALKRPETNMHGPVSPMEKNPPGTGGCAMRGVIMFSAAHPHNLSVVMAGRISWYGSVGSDAGAAPPARSGQSQASGRPNGTKTAFRMSMDRNLKSARLRNSR